MNTQRRVYRITAVAFIVAFVLCGSVQASKFFSLTDRSRLMAVEQPAGLLDLAAAWLKDAWNGLTGASAEETFVPPPPTTQGNCDSGWGIDPEGCPQ